MRFPVSGVECSPLVPPVVAFAISCLTAPAGVSGAFLLLPFQMSVLGFTSPAVTATNLIYNLLATPGGIWRAAREGRLDWRLWLPIAAGSVPGVAAGALIRVRYLPSPAAIRPFIALVLLALVWRLLAPPTAAGHARRRLIVPVSFAVGLIGGIYGIGGGAFVAPFLLGVCGIPAARAAGPALLATFLTSLAGVAAFESLAPAAHPDWPLGLLFGAGGLLGTYTGIRIQKYLPERAIRLGLAGMVAALAVSYLKSALFN
jgi:hypothetical protein